MEESQGMGAAVEDRARLREARQHMSGLIRACRQTITYLQGKSCLDERRLRRVLEEVVRSGERYLARK